MDGKDIAEPPTFAIGSGAKAAITDVDVVVSKPLGSAVQRTVSASGPQPPGPSQHS